MAKEQKATEQATANFAVETTENGNFVIEREAIKDKHGKQLATQDGRLYFAYILRGKLRGREVKVDFSPKDKGGYLPLDLVFDVSQKAELDISEVVQEMNGVKSRRLVYTVSTADEDGQLWKCEVKPTRNSDRDLLFMLMNIIGKTVQTVEDDNKSA